MSWIFGILKKNKQVVLPEKSYYQFSRKEKFSVETKDYYFACGKGHRNSFYKYDRNTDSGWMVCGTGISYEDNSFHLMDFHDWEGFLSKKNNNIRNLNGHFIIVEWENCNLRIRNDQLGMRDMFFTQTEEYIAFSTRLDWLIPFIKEPEIDFEIFSSSWLCVNPLTYDCFIKNAQRLGPGGTARYEDNNFTKYNKPWLPEYAFKIPGRNYFELISEINTLGIKQDIQLILGLSGGIDSRVLLSILLQQDRKKWSAYTYGDSNFPDVIIAKKLAINFGFTHKTISNLIPSIECEIDNFTEYVLQTHAYINGYFFYEQDHYELLDKNHLLIDGGKGEYCTRSFAKWLFLKGQDAILNRNYKKVLVFLVISKPNIFKQELMKLMMKSCELQIKEHIDTLPPIKEIGAGNWVDLFTIRTRTSILGSLTQSRLDGIIYNYMPFLQPSFLRKILSLSSKYRSKNKIYKTIMKKGETKLKRFPLVKGYSIIPFTYNNYMSHIFGKVYERFQVFQTTDYSKLFLMNNMEYVQDTMHSKEVREYPYFDYENIHNMVQGYYSGKDIYAKDILWWLTFDVWRKKLQKESSKYVIA